MTKQKQIRGRINPLSCVRTSSSYVLQHLIREERKYGMPSRTVHGPYSCKSIFLPGNRVSGLLPCTRIPGPFIRNLSWHIRCLIILTPHTHSPEDTFIWRKRELFFTWNSVTILPVDTNNNIWIRPFNSKKSCGRRDASTAVRNNRQRSRGVRSQFYDTAQKTYLGSPIWARPKNVLNWRRLKCLQEIVKLR